MTYFPVVSPFEIFFDLDGNPLEDGYIYIGEANQNPITNQITVYWDSTGLYPAAQPIRTIDGYPDRNGSPAKIYVNAGAFEDYSILINDKHGRLVFSAQSARFDAMANGNTIDLFNDLRSISGYAQPIYIRGHSAIGDGGQGRFEWFAGLAPGTYVDDNGITAVPIGGDGSAAWVRQFNGAVDPRMFGAIGDGITDDRDALFNALNSSDGREIDLNGLTFNIVSSSIYVDAPNGIIIKNGNFLFNFATQQESGIRITTASGTIKLSNINSDGNNTVAKIMFVRSNGSGAILFVSNFLGKNALQTVLTGSAVVLNLGVVTDGTDLFESVHITNSRFTDVDSNGGSLIGRGIVIDSTRNALVDNCHFENIGPYQDGDGIFVTDATAYSTFRFTLTNCTFYNCQKRSIKSQVAKTFVGNIVVRRALSFTAAAGQCDVDLQDGGAIDGATLYFNNGCAPPRFIAAALREQNQSIAIRNITIIAEDPTDIVENIIQLSQADDIYCKNAVIENITGNCRMDYFFQTTGEGFSTDPGSSAEYLFQNLIFRDINFPNGFNPAPATDPTTGQLYSAFHNVARSAAAYIQVKYSAYNVHIGVDDTVQSAYLNSGSGTIVYLASILEDHFNCKGFDTSSYDGTGAATFTVAPVNEYSPYIFPLVENTGQFFYTKSESIAEDETYSKQFSRVKEGGCKVILTYGSRDAIGTKLYTEGIFVNGGGVLDYFETVAGDKTSTNTGTIAAAVVSGTTFEITKTAGSTTAGGVLAYYIFHDGFVNEI